MSHCRRKREQRESICLETCHLVGVKVDYWKILFQGWICILGHLHTRKITEAATSKRWLHTNQTTFGSFAIYLSQRKWTCSASFWSWVNLPRQTQCIHSPAWHGAIRRLCSISCLPIFPPKKGKLSRKLRKSQWTLRWYLLSVTSGWHSLPSLQET